MYDYDKIKKHTFKILILTICMGMLYHFYALILFIHYTLYNAVLNLINHQPHVDKIYFYAKDPYEAK